LGKGNVTYHKPKNGKKKERNAKSKERERAEATITDEKVLGREGTVVTD